MPPRWRGGNRHGHNDAGLAGHFRCGQENGKGVRVAKMKMLDWAGPLAVLLWIGAVLVFGARLEGYDQLRHPVSLLGARGVPGGTLFSMLGFVLPGLLAVLAALGVILRMPATAPRVLRVAGQMLLLAAVAFMAMGWLPLDVEDIENPASQLHASAWLLWLVGFAAGAIALRLGAARAPAWRPLATLALVCALWSVCSAFLFEIAMPAAMAQRLAFLGWLGWLAAAWRLLPRRD